MSFSFASMIRLLALGVVGLTMLAVGVSRLAPPPATVRVAAPVTTVSINDHLLRVSDRHPRWLDMARGTVEMTPLTGDDVLEVASCSPWADAQGNRQVVGRWSNRTLNGPETVAHDFGIARFSYPAGELIEQIPLEHFPISPPCWLPGERARVLFAAGDGRLRRFDFEPGGTTDDLEGSGAADSRATPVAWECPQPGLDEASVSEVAPLSWSGDRLGGLLTAALRYRIDDPERGLILSRSESWWLRLDPSGTRIKAAGPLLDRRDGGDATGLGDERSPTVASLPDGSLGLAFARELPRAGWSICLGTLEITPEGRPVCREATVRVLDVREHPGPLAFSPDGRWLNTLIIGRSDAPTVRRFGTLGTADARPDRVASAR